MLSSFGYINQLETGLVGSIHDSRQKHVSNDINNNINNNNNNSFRKLLCTMDKLGHRIIARV